MLSAGLLWRAALVVAVFILVGVVTDRAITAHAVAHGSPEITVRMAAAMAGLFSGGAIACLLGITLFLLRPREGRG